MTYEPFSPPEPTAEPTPEPTAEPTPEPTAEPGDTTAPAFIDMSVTDLTETTVEVTWTVDEPATGQLEYGPDGSFGSFSVKETSFDYATHVQTITGLDPGTTYHVRAISEDQAGNRAVSTNHTFTTESTPAPPAPDPIPTRHVRAGHTRAHAADRAW